MTLQKYDDDTEGVFERLRKTQYYRQGSAARPLYISYPWQSTQDLRLYDQSVPEWFRDMLGYFKDGHVWIYMPHAAFRRIADWYIGKYHENPAIANELYHWWVKNPVATFLNAIEHVVSLEMTTVSDDVLLEEWNTFAEQYIDVWRHVIFLDTFDLFGDVLLEEEMRKLHIVLSTQDRQTLLTAHDPSWMQREECDLLAIMQANDNMQDALHKHAQKYHWIRNDFLHITQLSPNYFLDKINNARRHADIMNGWVGIASHLRDVRNEKQRIIKKHALSKEAQNLFQFFTTLSTMRDHRKAYNQMASGVIHAFVREVSRRTNIDISLLEQLFHEEVGGVFALTRNDIEILKSRDKGACVLNVSQKKRMWMYGDKGHALFGIVNKPFAENTNLKGLPASKGKVIGSARVIMGQDEFHKMQPGDIIIAPNTRPEYLPVLKIAAAIVTEEGGITSHAAIVSRELQKPGVVGVQGATDAIHDGDEIEVDADNGIIKILKKYQ